MHDIYTRIMQEAQRTGLNGKEIGVLLGLKKSPLTDWKNGKSLPTTEQIIKLCEIFAVSSDYLIFGSTHLLSPAENTLITNFQKLSSAEQTEIINYIDYKLYLHEKKKISSHHEKFEDATKRIDV